jgi:predicted DCC family thiol-disulfide oxidoreductase YuxK
MNTTTRFCVPLTVYYDNSCPLCATEMHVIEKLDWRGRLKLVDCSAPGFDDRAAAKEGITREAMMTKLHVRDPEGRWLVALDAFEAVYASAGLDKAARIWGNRKLRPLLDKIYPVVARHRQPLSRLGLHKIVGAFMRLAARVAPGRY